VRSCCSPLYARCAPARNDADETTGAHPASTYGYRRTAQGRQQCVVWACTRRSSSRPTTATPRPRPSTAGCRSCSRSVASASAFGSRRLAAPAGTAPGCCWLPSTRTPAPPRPGTSGTRDTLDTHVLSITAVLDAPLELTSLPEALRLRTPLAHRRAFASVKTTVPALQTKDPSPFFCCGPRVIPHGSCAGATRPAALRLRVPRIRTGRAPA
jgi:hypothetical protein